MDVQHRDHRHNPRQDTSTHRAYGKDPLDGILNDNHSMYSRPLGRTDGSFDSVCTSMSCVSTGGFSPHSAGLDYWDSAYINGTMTIFMFVSGINFIILYRVARGDRKSLTGNDVFRCYCMILGVSYMITLLSLLISGEPRSLRNLLIDPLCQTVSAFTSTGVSSMPYEIMRPSVVAVLTLLMGIGACAGSTSGGLKTDRLLVICKNARNESRRILYPNRMNAIHVNGTYLSDGILIKIFAFLACYLFCGSRQQ